jgi:hypothetical protein
MWMFAHHSWSLRWLADPEDIVALSCGPSEQPVAGTSGREMPHISEGFPNQPTNLRLVSTRDRNR